MTLFAQTLSAFAASLAQQEWDATSLRRHLETRLPPRLHRLAPLLSGELIRAFPKTVAPDTAVIEAFLRQAPGFHRVTAFALKTGHAPRPWFEPDRFAPSPTFAGLGLPELATTSDLADWLGIDDRALLRFADLRRLSALEGDDFARHYRCHVLVKPSGALRLIEEPKPVLKTLQRRILHGLLNHVPPHPASFGFTPGRNCVTAAARHAGEAMVMGFDLADFFPRIDFARVYAIFRTLGYPAPVARSLAGLCTAVTPPDFLHLPDLAAREALKSRHLPQGAPSSPALANLAALPLDRRLAGLARSLEATYTRYADDLSFSGDARIAPVLARAVPEIVEGEGFRLNPAKTRKASAGQRQVVTGLVVNSHVNVPRAEFDRLKATLHRLSDPADPRRQDLAFLKSLDGRIAWVEQVNPHRGLKLRAALARAFG